MPIVLDPSDYSLQLERAVRKLDELMYNPRSVIFSNAESGFVDVTALHMDEITAVYYSQDSISTLMGGLDLGVGIMPILTSQMMPLTALDSMIDYLIIKSIMNSVQRKMMNAWDYTLLPMNSDGKQFLQIKNTGNLFWCEYLPYLDPKADVWEMFENEYSFVIELAFAYICSAQIEATMMVTILGVGREAANLSSYWDKKIETIIKEFTDSSIINYVG